VLQLVPGGRPESDQPVSLGRSQWRSISGDARPARTSRPPAATPRCAWRAIASRLPYWSFALIGLSRVA
jgi:hypothetical protein